LISAFIPLGLQIVFLNALFTRYLLFILVPLMVLAAGQLDRGLGWLQNRKPEYTRLVIPALVMLALPGLWFDFQIVVDPYQAALPQADRSQYIEGPWNGTGIAEVKTFLEKE